ITDPDRRERACDWWLPLEASLRFGEVHAPASLRLRTAPQEIDWLRKICLNRVNTMTAAFDHDGQTISQLIDSCWKAEHGFRSASERVANRGLKTLLSIYARQSSRFAEELRDFAAGKPGALGS